MRSYISSDFLRLAGQLKTTFRYEELLPGRKESVADHSWRVSLLALMLGHMLDTDEERSRAVLMSIVHDIAEAVTGDIDHIRIATGEVSRETKKRLEAEALAHIGTMLPDYHRDSLLGLVREYDAAETSVARFVKAIDKLETLLQLIELGYRSYDHPALIANYADPAVDAFPALKPVLSELKASLYEEFRKGNIEWKPEYGEV